MKRVSMNCMILATTVLMFVLSIDIVCANDTEGFDVIQFEDTMLIGSSQTITATIYPAGSDKTVTYRSYDETIAEVSPGGVITAKKKGTTKILLSMGKMKKTLDLGVIVETERIRLNSRYVTIKHGEQFRIKAKALPKSTAQTFTYRSTNSDIIQVDKKGLVTGIKSGAAAVIVSNGQLSESVTIIVNQNVQQKSKAEKTETDRQRRSQEDRLAEKIKNSASKQISFYASTGEIIDEEALMELRKSEKELIVKDKSFDFLLSGKEIVNCENEIATKFGIQKTKNGVKIQVNKGKPLPGKIVLLLHDQDMRNARYMYLFDENKERYQMLDAKAGNSVSIDLGGRYYLTFYKLYNFRFRSWHGLMGILAIGILLGLYVIVKKRYWFW